MHIGESFKIAIDSIRANKLRSILTTLGIIIGVMTVVTVVSLISGLNKKVADMFSSIGSNVIYVQKWPWVQTGDDWWKYRGRKDIKPEHAEAIKRLCSSVELVSPLDGRAMRIRYKDERTNPVSVDGVAPDYQQISGRDLESGRYITELDNDRKKRVCVIGTDIVDKLFPKEDPLNKTVRIGSIKFVVIGVLEKKGQMLGHSMDNEVVIPFNTFRKLFLTQGREDISIAMLAKDKEEAIDEVRGVMRRLRDVQPGKPDDFSINTQDVLMDMYSKITGAAFVVMIGVASLSLLIGGIGIMNIMLVSVTERTREIGVRKAIGARYRDILYQFLTEAVVISGFGGIIGIIVGFTLARIVSVASNLPSAIPLWAVLLGFGFSTGVGIFFGIYPANKAARLDPVEALRYE
jgi:putative ABC transport system permease protein